MSEQESNQTEDWISAPKEVVMRSIEEGVRRGYALGYEQGKVIGRNEENEACAALAQRELLLNAGKASLIGSLPAMIRSRNRKS